MAIVKITPAAAAPVPGALAPVGLASPMMEARSGIGSVREILSLIQELRGLAREAGPLLEMIRPAQPVAPPDDGLLPRGAVPSREYVEPVPMRVEPAAPPASEKAAAAVEEERALREAIKGVVRQFKRETIIECATEIAPMALLEKRPETAEAIAKHADALREILLTVPEEEMRAFGCVLADRIPASAKELKFARSAIEAILKRQSPPEEPKKDGEGA